MQALTPIAYKSYSLLFLASLLFCFGLIPTLNLALIFGFSCMLFVTTRHSSRWKVLDVMYWIFTLALGFLLAVYRPSNFDYPLLWKVSELYEGGAAFALYANISKALGGYIVVMYLLKFQANETMRLPLTKSISVAALATAVILLVANAVFDVSWQPKIPSGLLYFVSVNLLITVLAEEAFFRLLIQKRLSLFFSNRTLGLWISAVVATLIFALAHSTEIGPGFMLYIFSGGVYSLVYAYTQRFSVALGLHFGTNILHFLLLEYPISL